MHTFSSNLSSKTASFKPRGEKDDPVQYFSTGQLLRDVDFNFHNSQASSILGVEIHVS